ncbi:MAG: tripartite tricarboxylate transporter TctB family protein [Rhodospirillales bacterium]
MSEAPHSPTGHEEGAPRDAGGSSSGWFNRTDVVVAVILLAVCVAAWQHSTYWPEPMAAFTHVVPPTFFPRLVLGFIIVLLLFLPLEQRLKGEKGAELDKDRSDRIKPITYVTTLVTVLIGATMEWVGTVVTIVLICVVLPLLWGERRWKYLVPFIILFPIVVLVLFKGLFSINFEPGVIGLGFK